MRYLLIVLLGLPLTAGSLVTGCKSMPEQNEDPSVLFALVADSGSIDGNILMLYGVPRVTWFTDRPYRKAGFTLLDNFLAAWDTGHSFASDPPNAILAIPDSQGIDETVIELKNAEQKNGAIIFQIIVIEGELPTGKFGPATLFIDQICDCPTQGCYNCY